MERKISYQQFQSVKAIAKAIDPITRKAKTIQEKIASLQKDYEQQLALQESMEAGIVSIIGFHVSELVKKVTEPTGAVDPKTGKPVMTTKYVPTDIVCYDEQAKQYVVNIPDIPVPEEMEAA